MEEDLKRKLKFHVRILAVKPRAGYMDTVYTQLVLVELGNGQRAYVFDGAFEGYMLCTPEMIGKTKKIVLVMLVNSLAKVEVRAVSISPDPSRPSLDTDGCIDEIIIPDEPQNAERWHDAIVDFGVGKVLIEIDKKYFPLQLKEGDYVHVNGRVDLRGIE